MPRFKRGIQYAVTSRVGTAVSGILGRPVKPGDDTEWLFEILDLTKVRKAHDRPDAGSAHPGSPPESIAKKPHAFRKMDAGSTPL
jgi:hypothetical protein